MLHLPNTTNNSNNNNNSNTQRQLITTTPAGPTLSSLTVNNIDQQQQHIYPNNNPNHPNGAQNTLLNTYINTSQTYSTYNGYNNNNNNNLSTFNVTHGDNNAVLNALHLLNNPQTQQVQQNNLNTFSATHGGNNAALNALYLLNNISNTPQAPQLQHNNIANLVNAASNGYTNTNNPHQSQVQQCYGTGGGNVNNQQATQALYNNLFTSSQPIQPSQNNCNLSFLTSGGLLPHNNSQNNLNSLPGGQGVFANTTNTTQSIHNLYNN